MCGIFPFTSQSSEALSHLQFWLTSLIKKINAEQTFSKSFDLYFLLISIISFCILPALHNMQSIFENLETWISYYDNYRCYILSHAADLFTLSTCMCVTIIDM